MADLHTELAAQPQDNLEAIAGAMVQRATEPQMQRICAQYMGRIKLPENARVLEIGCGNGAATKLMLKYINPAALVGIDPAPALISMAKTALANEPRVSFVVGNAVKTGQIEATFDLVIAHTVFSHLPDAEGALAEAYRVLRQDGQLVIFDVDHTDTVNGSPFASSVATIFGNIIHAPFIMRRLPKLALKAGFVIEELRPYRYVHTVSAELLVGLLSHAINASAQSASSKEVLLRRIADEIQKKATNGTLSSDMQFLSLIGRKPILRSSEAQ